MENNAVLEARLKTLSSIFDLDDATLEVMVSNINPRETKDNLFRMFGPSSPTLMAATIMDILTIKQMGDDDYSPSQFVCGPCDPAIPLLINEAQMGWIQSHAVPYQKRVWSSSYCSDEDFMKAMLSEIPNLPWGRRQFTQRQKEAMMTAKAMRQMAGEMRASWSRMWTDDFLWGAMMIEGPGIPKTVADDGTVLKGTVLDMCRNAKLFGQLEGDGWCNPNADRAHTIRNWADHVYEQSGDAQSYPNTFIVDKVGKKMLFDGVEFQKCDPCQGNYNPFVSRPQTNLGITVDRADQVRGMQRIDYRDPVLGDDAEFYCLDETRNKCIDENGDKVKEKILPDGVMVAFNRNTHAPIGLHGRIQNRQTDAPMELYTRTFDCDTGCSEDGKFGARMESAPMYFNRRENTIGMLYLGAPKCPPRTKGVSKAACNPHVFGCDPEGGKKIVAESRAAEARQAQAIAEAAMKIEKSKQTEARTEKANKKPQLGANK